MAWVRVASAAEVAVGEAHASSASGRELALFNVDGTFYACDGVCTHAHAHLADGYLDGDEIECPMHAGRFNVRTGAALCAPARIDLATYPVEVRQGEIHVDLPD